MAGVLKRLVFVPTVVLVFILIPLVLGSYVFVWVIVGHQASTKMVDWWMELPDALWDWAVE